MDSGNTTTTYAPDEVSPIADMQKLDLGALLLGCVIQAIFYGNSLSLLWRYITKGRAEDPRWYSIAIVFAGLLCTFSVFVTTDALWYFVFGMLFQRGSQSSPPWSIDFFLLVIALVTALVRALYVYRLWRVCWALDRFRWRTLFIAMLILTAIFTTADLGKCGHDSALRPVVRYFVSIVPTYNVDTEYRYTSNGSTPNRSYAGSGPIFCVAFATGISADITLIALMSFSSHHARTDMYRTNCLADSLIVYIVQTGLLPGLMDVACIISFIAMPTSKLFIAFYVQVGVLYLTSLLSSLNTGRFVKKRVKLPICVNFSALDRVVVDPGPPFAQEGSSFCATRAPSLAIDEDTHSIYVPDELYYTEEKELTPDIEQAPQQLEREPLTTPYTYVMRPRAFTLPSHDRRPCT
ncbi:uncharacterized protein TRAVEDRAFT_71760 [Trametes versicolor FP-101664 SS1]|uniref:uncharacterized protein n=1 Tax=Trametes versicolor (strain FP-101664) TaxID=717944 RepID=UPI0004622040|nr:uncharacterized protein TRAVEDRAFT_71760 [Trametes versicolor FP-101664 SS1]EIW59833.1 hypothetical protein TRAVEDRAFT_71760 [Trametes versicolor FP-101664 SS1]